MNTRISILKRISKYAKESRIEIILMLFLNIVSIPVSFINPYLFSVLIDNVMGMRQINLFKYVCYGLLGVFVARFIIDLIKLICSNKLLNRFTFILRKDIWKKYLKLNFNDYDHYEAGDIKMRLFDDVDNLGNFINDQLVDYVFNILLVISYLIVMLKFNYKISLISLCIIPLVFYVNHLIGKGMQETNEEMRQVNEEYYSFEHNTFQYWKEIKALNVERSFIEKFKAYRKMLGRIGMKFIRYWFFGEVFNDFKANYLSKILIYIIGAFFVINGEITIGTIFMFAEYFGTLFNGLDVLNGKNISLKVNMPFYQRVFELLDKEVDINDNKEPFIFQNAITAQDVDFSYNNEAGNVINGINLNIKKGDYLAIIGKSGCGKTTLMKLLTGIYSADSGEILVDGINIDDINKKSIFKKIGIVMQDSYVFNMSIEENLRLSNRYATKEELRAVCAKANILDFIESLPDGFNTLIGERGIKLSGGQKQRLSIARALIGKPEIVFFDEATSSLDKMSEDIINNSINEISNDVTVIVISHKPATVLRARNILVIDNGEVVAEGGQDELVDSNKYYREMIN